MSGVEKLTAELRAGLDGVTPGAWQVIDQRHPWRLEPCPEWGRPDEATGEHIERQIATTWHHPQSHAPWQVVCSAIGVGLDKPVSFVHIEEADAAHIARCSPDNILALLDAFDTLRDEKEKLEKENEALRAALLVTDREAAKVEELLVPHVKWEPGAIRICPMRDGPCPHGFNCQFVGDGYMGWPCKEGWSSHRAPSTPSGGDHG
jgi:hypothetical protein